MKISYAIESWIFSVFFLAWISLRILSARSLIEESLVYSCIVNSTINLIGISLNKSFPVQPFFAYQITISAFYVLLFSMGIDESSQSYFNLKGDIRPECANKNLASMVRKDFFDDNMLFVMPGSVTLAFQVMQIFTSAAALGHDNIFVGHSVGYGLLSLLCLTIFMWLANVFQLVCPVGDINVFISLDISVYFFFLLLCISFLIWIVFEGFSFNYYSNLLSRFMGILLSFLAATSIVYTTRNRNMLSIPLAIYIAFSFVLVVTGLWPDKLQIKEDPKEERKTVKWIVPPSIPKPLTMDELKPTYSKSKKKL